MRLVACLAGHPAGVLHRVDLRETAWFGGAGRMAANAQHGCVDLVRLDGWVVRVLCQRTVAGLAVHVLVLARLLRLRNVGMAGLAGLVAGVVQRAGGNLADGRPAVVAVLSEALRHNEVPHHKKDRERHHEEKRKAEEMSSILG